MRNVEFRNRKGKKLTAILKEIKNPKGTFILMHGGNDSKERGYMLRIQDAFFDKGYTVLNFDPYEKEGFSPNGFYRDLEDTIRWTKEQSFFKGKLSLSGHSLGGYSVCKYAQENKDEIETLVLIAPFISLLSSLKYYKKRGKKFNLLHLLNIFRYNLIPKAHKLTMNVFIIVGSEDWVTPKEGAKKLFHRVKGKKEYKEIVGARHVYDKKEEMDEIYSYIVSVIQ